MSVLLFILACCPTGLEDKGEEVLKESCVSGLEWERRQPSGRPFLMKKLYFIPEYGKMENCIVREDIIICIKLQASNMALSKFLEQLSNYYVCHQRKDTCRRCFKGNA